MDQVNIEMSVESLKAQVRTLISGQRESLVKATMLSGVLCFPFMICAFVAAGTANAGFNVVLTAFLEIGFQAASYYYLATQPSRSAFTVGFLTSSSVFITIMMLQTAIFWGQLANCESVKEDINQYSCTNPTGYSAVSFFASLLFIVQLLSTYGLYVWREEITSLEDQDYDKLPINISAGSGAESPYDEHGLHREQSADL
jgi:hypothetical protein